MSEQNGLAETAGVQGDGLPFSPHGLHVLAVDDDKLCLKVIAKMLQQCHYEVQTCSDANEALAHLRDTNNHFDLVLSDVVMPDVDGFKLLEIIGLEMDIPVIMMSYDGDTHTVLKGVMHGAVDFLIKPVRLEELSNMWQHVVRKRRTLPSSEERGQPDTGTTGMLKRTCSHSSGDIDHNQAVDAVTGTSPDSKKRGNEDKNNPQNAKRPRVHWSSHMHSQFVAAVNKLGIDKAVPKKILELMGVDGLTRENVASHLQKYRLYLKKAAKIDGGAAVAASQPQLQPAAENKPAAPNMARQPTSAPAHTEAPYTNYRVPQESVMMANVQQVAQPQMQPVYAGVPAGTYMAQPQWQSPIMCSPVPQHGAYMQPMPQAPWGQQPMMQQQVAACMPMEHQQASAGFPHGVPVGMSPHGPAATAGYSGVSAQAPMHMGVGTPSTLPPLSAERVDDDMENEFPVKPGDLNEVMPIDGLNSPLVGDGVDDACIPEEMDDFLNILANGGQNNSI